MTQEQRVFITADDVLELEFCCTNEKCNARISFPIEKASVPMQCPACNIDWFIPYKDDERKRLFYALIDSIKGIRALKSVPLTLRMRVSSGHAEGGRV
jgi:hypothetical protein